jgi:hypothetical protein
MPATPLRAITNPAWAWIIVLFFALLPAVTPRLYASDEVQYFSYLRSVWFDGDVSFENEYQHFYDAGVARSAGFHETFLERQTETGRRLNFGTIGSAVLWAPFYAVAHLWARMGSAEADGYSRPYLLAVAVGSAVYGWLALLLATSIARTVVGGARPASVASLAVWFGTPLVFYMYVAPPMAHACSAFTVALFIWIWLRVRTTWPVAGLAALGASAALMAMVREQDVFLVIGPACDVLASLASRRTSLGRVATGVVTGAATFALTFVPQALAYWSLNGYVGPSRLVTRKMTWYAPHGLEVLTSPEHGFFWWTPLAVVACAGLAGLAAAGQRDDARATTDRRALLWGFLLMVASQVYVAGSVESWTVAGAFGQRRFVNLTALLVVGVAACISWCQARGWSRACAAVLAFCVWWNVGLMAQFGTGAMDRQRLEPWKNARYTFVALPVTFPSLVSRYLFDRQSFYKPSR